MNLRKDRGPAARMKSKFWLGYILYVGSFALMRRGSKKGYLDKVIVTGSL
jgi:hypothetical protein